MGLLYHWWKKRVKTLVSLILIKKVLEIFRLQKSVYFGLDETIRKYNEIGSNIHLIDQPPFQNIHAKYIYNYLNKHQNKDSNKILLKFSVSSKESKNFNFKNNEIFKKRN